MPRNIPSLRSQPCEWGPLFGKQRKSNVFPREDVLNDMQAPDVTIIIVDKWHMDHSSRLSHSDMLSADLHYADHGKTHGPSEHPFSTTATKFATTRTRLVNRVMTSQRIFSDGPCCDRTTRLLEIKWDRSGAMPTQKMALRSRRETRVS